MIHTIHVTREDLEYPYFLPCGCPIWHALKREFPMARISVGGTYFSINDVHYSLPGPLGIYGSAFAVVNSKRPFWFRFRTED